MAKIRRSDLAPQEPPAAPHAALYDQDNDTDFAPTAPAGPEKKRGSLAYTLAMLFFGVVFLVSLTYSIRFIRFLCSSITPFGFPVEPDV